jgi:glycosyltransferase involved in cell wall biosynthesis
LAETPIRLGLFIDRLAPGGTQRQFLALLARLDRTRFQPFVSCFDDAGAWFDCLAALDIPATVFPIRGFARLDTFRKLAAFAQWSRRYRIDVVHTWELYSNIFGLPGAAAAGVPVRIGSRRGLNPDRTAGQRRLQRLAYAAAHRVVANSEAAARLLREEGVPSARVTIVRNGIDLSPYSSRTDRSCLRRVVMVAGLRRIKGLDVLVMAAAKIVARVPDARFVIVGEGPERESALLQVRQFGLENSFEFLGHRDDVPALLAEADLFVLPSRSEAFPNAVIEAMAAGLPVVATRVGGIVELVQPERTGVLVPSDDPEALAAAVMNLMARPDQANALGRAARQEVERQYSLSSMVGRFEELYESELLARSQSRRKFPDRLKTS